MYSATSLGDMLRCSESTMSCICSSVGRLTVDMGPPSDVMAAGAAGAAVRDRPLRADADGTVDERTDATVEAAPPLAGARAEPFADAATVNCGRGRTAPPLPTEVLRAPPRPTSS